MNLIPWRFTKGCSAEMHSLKKQDEPASMYSFCKQTASLEEDDDSCSASTDEMTDEQDHVPQDSIRRSINKVDKDDCVVGSKLGKGTFASVFSVQLKESSTENEEDQQSGNSDDDQGHPKNSKKGLRKKRHAMKMIRQSINSAHREAIASDLYAEAETLKKLPEHPNIISLLGMSSNMLEDPKSPKSSAFLIFERLDGTLEDRLTRWSIRALNQKKKAPRAILPRQRRSLQVQKFRDQQDRLRSCAMGVAKALNHLHQHGILYLDLKPANVGFDYEGNVKLFDFGISQNIVELSGSEGSSNKAPKGPVGTPRYMAPEIAKLAQSSHDDASSNHAASSSPYSFPADVFSFSILLWEVCTLEKPFGRYKSMDSLIENCQAKQQRPKVSLVVSLRMQGFLERCWNENPQHRPTFPSMLSEGTLEALLEERADDALK